MVKESNNSYIFKHLGIFDFFRISSSAFSDFLPCPQPFSSLAPPCCSSGALRCPPPGQILFLSFVFARVPSNTRAKVHRPLILAPFPGGDCNLRFRSQQWAPRRHLSQPPNETRALLSTGIPGSRRRSRNRRYRCPLRCLIFSLIYVLTRLK